MRRLAVQSATLLLFLVFATSAAAQQEVIDSIQVQGNTLTPDDQVVADSGLVVGELFSADRLQGAVERLQATKRYRGAEALKRYASISDASKVTVLLRVDEGPVEVLRSSAEAPAHAVHARGLRVMFAPVLTAEDGYGVIYGAQLSLSDKSSSTSRIVFPLTWGGDKRAGFEVQHESASRKFPAIRMGGLVERRTHPYFRSDADRKRGWLTADWAIGHSTHAGTTLGWQQATLEHRVDRTVSFGADIVLDTRVDTLLPRNAAYGRASLERTRFENDSATHIDIDASYYLGLPFGDVLVIRGTQEQWNKAVPPYFKSILGGADNLRGFRAGTAIGDSLLATSLELRVPLSSPLSIARVGASLFVDSGTTYDTAARFTDQRMMNGIGGGFWAGGPLFHISLMVARGLGSGTRVHFGGGVTF